LKGETRGNWVGYETGVLLEACCVVYQLSCVEYQVNHFTHTE